MRISMLAVAFGLGCYAVPVAAQTVINVEGQTSVAPAAPEPDKAPPQQQPPAQESAPPIPPGRFAFTRVGDGFLRLDTDSGQVAYCSAQGRGWTCQATSESQPALEKDLAKLQDDVTALKALKDDIAGLQSGIAAVKNLQAEIARLQDEVASLKKDIVALKEPPPPRPPADLAPAEKSDERTIKLPTREDMARARAFIEDTWRRLVEMINTVQKDMMRKG